MVPQRLKIQAEIRVRLESLVASIAAPKADNTGLEELEELSERFAVCSSNNELRIAELNEALTFGVAESVRLPLLSSLLRLPWGLKTPPEGVPRPHEESIKSIVLVLNE